MEPKKNPAKDVHRYSKHFFLIGFIISCSISIMAFEWKTEVTKKACPKFSNPVEPPMELYPVPVTSFQDEPAAPLPKKIQVLIDPDKLVVDNSTDDAGDKDAPEIIVEFPNDKNSGEFPLEIEKEVAQDTFILVQNMPVPVGGYESFYKQVAKSMKYPRLAKSNGTEGRVYVEFVINETGDPIRLKVTKGIGSGCDEEAKRVISQIKWVPGNQRGKPVLVKMTLPIYFKLQ
jgi:protein TonB